MRKISTYLALLLGFITGAGVATAQENVYLLNEERGNKLLHFSEGGVTAVDAGDADANSLWQIVPTGEENAYRIRNVETGSYLGTCETSVPIVLAPESEAGIYELSRDKRRDLFHLQGGGDYQYLHLDASLHLVGWETSAGASRWIVCPEAQLPEALANCALRPVLEAAVLDGNQVYAQTLPQAHRLITSGSQFSSNNKDPEEGSYEALLDYDATTFFHSNWHAAGDVDHDLCVVVAENTATDLTVHYTARLAGGQYNDRPVRMSVYGGQLDAEGQPVFETTPFAELTAEDGLGEVSGSFKLSCGTVYKAFRFEVHETVMSTGAQGNRWFTYSEFQMYDGTTDAPHFEVSAELAAAVKAALDAAAEANPLEDDYQAMIDAISEAVAAVRDAAGAYRVELRDEATALRIRIEPYLQQPGMPGYFSADQIAGMTAAIERAFSMADDEAVTDEACGDYREELLALEAAYKADVVRYPTDCYFVVNNEASARGAIVYDPAQFEAGRHDAAFNDYLWYAATPDVADPNHLWGFYEGRDGEHYLYNVGRRLFASSAGEGTYDGRTWIFSDVPSAITLESMGDLRIHIQGDGETMSVSRGFTGPVINYYAPSDAGVPFKFIRATAGLDDDVTLEIERLLSGAPTGVAGGEAGRGLRVESVTGGVAVTAGAEATVSVVGAAGAVMRRLQLAAGTTQTVSLPAGVYVVGGRKVLVR